MTATPIPRTLMLTAYGDIDVSRLTEKPAGRQPIDTRTLAGRARWKRSSPAVKRAIDERRPVYWICPLVDESEAIDLTAATDAPSRTPGRCFGDRVGLVHGKHERRRGARPGHGRLSRTAQSDILVATTVIEVGVNVPDATVMVIEHAERFGLAQLHQLRGRVGRGERQIELPAALPSAARRDRQGAAADHARHRGRLPHRRGRPAPARRRRGAGHAQSGLPDFRLVDLAAHGDLIPVARDDAKLAFGAGSRTGRRSRACLASCSTCSSGIRS